MKNSNVFSEGRILDAVKLMKDKHLSSNALYADLAIQRYFFKVTSREIIFPKFKASCKIQLLLRIGLMIFFLTYLITAILKNVSYASQVCRCSTTL